jgi:hypothetical protein
MGDKATGSKRSAELLKYNEPVGIRTRDLLIKSQLLYRLSYGLAARFENIRGAGRPVNRQWFRGGLLALVVTYGLTIDARDSEIHRESSCFTGPLFELSWRDPLTRAAVAADPGCCCS